MKETYVFEEVDPKLIQPAFAQPEGRTLESSALNALARSIADMGLQYPPLVVRNKDGNGFTTVDGHRRIKAMKLLHGKIGRYEKVPVLIADGKPEELFAAVCGTTKALTALQWLEVHLKNGFLPSGPTKSAIVQLETLMGREFLQDLLKKGLSPQVWSVAGRLMKYCSLSGDETKKNVLVWIATHRLTRVVSAWISGGYSAGTLKDAFEQNLPTIDHA